MSLTDAVIVMLEDAIISGGEGTKCDVCSLRSPLKVPLVAVDGNVYNVCRDRHFHGLAVDAWTGAKVNMVGPKMLDTFLWFPEGFVLRLRKAEYERIMAEATP